MIETVTFDILSPDELRKKSKVEVTESDCFRGDKVKEDGPCDLRMGAFDRFPCQTCGKRQECAGHFGHIELVVPMLNPTLRTQVKRILDVICLRCCRLKQRNVKSIKKLHKSAKTKNVCAYPDCEKPYPIVSLNGSYMEISFTGQKPLRKVPLPPRTIYEYFSKIPSADIKRLRINYHPTDLLYTVFPVLDNPARPSVLSGHQVSVDKLSLRIGKIVAANKKLAKSLSENENETVIQNQMYILQDEIEWFFTMANISKSYSLKKQISKLHGSGGGMDEGIPLHARLRSKEGQLRSNMMGKRVNYSGRSVITGDPNLELDEFGIPFEVARNLPLKVKVNDHNKRKLQDMLSPSSRIIGESTNLEDIMNERAPPAKIVKVDSDEAVEIRRLIKKNGQIYDFRHDANAAKQHKLEIGDTVERALQDGDLVVVNRQPSLHRLSLMAYRVRRLPGKTFRMTLASTKAFNAD